MTETGGWGLVYFDTQKLHSSRTSAKSGKRVEDIFRAEAQVPREKPSLPEAPYNLSVLQKRTNF